MKHVAVLFVLTDVYERHTSLNTNQIHARQKDKDHRKNRDFRSIQAKMSNLTPSEPPESALAPDALLDRLPYPIFLTTRQGVIQWANSGLAELLNKSPEELHQASAQALLKDRVDPRGLLNFLDGFVFAAPGPKRCLLGLCFLDCLTHGKAGPHVFRPQVPLCPHLL